MKNNLQKKLGFTLIELLMVIAIIGILAGILIPTVGAVRKQANIAASKSQLSNYVTAITMFKGEYGYLPFVTGADDTIDLSSDSSKFIETLSGRKTDSTLLSATEAKSSGNRRRIAFHSFSESEFMLKDDDSVDQTQLADRFNNTVIKLIIDGNGDGFVNPNVTGTEPAEPDNPIKTEVTGWVEEDAAEGYPGYGLWD